MKVKEVREPSHSLTNVQEDNIDILLLFFALCFPSFPLVSLHFPLLPLSGVHNGPVGHLSIHFFPDYRKSRSTDALDFSSPLLSLRDTQVQLVP
ncbi:uncharacterized protein YALI1_D16873g [Yarrowia lipolytica]|uniref:Uncharacterized protein n=1 Tax=Yarrowia lipolytica TaxID=4952 RepID=A0A1D8NEG1_YARLL|nr:hypothetical protein YALI1_D16873g [Yarrowia lipolytica]